IACQIDSVVARCGTPAPTWYSAINPPPPAPVPAQANLRLRSAHVPDRRSSRTPVRRSSPRSQVLAEPPARSPRNQRQCGMGQAAEEVPAALDWLPARAEMEYHHPILPGARLRLVCQLSASRADLWLLNDQARLASAQLTV